MRFVPSQTDSGKTSTPISTPEYCSAHLIDACCTAHICNSNLRRRGQSSGRLRRITTWCSRRQARANRNIRYVCSTSSVRTFCCFGFHLQVLEYRSRRSTLLWGIVRILLRCLRHLSSILRCHTSDVGCRFLGRRGMGLDPCNSQSETEG